VVSNVKKSIEFYTQAIGFKELKGFSVPADWTKDVGPHATGRLSTFTCLPWGRKERDED
jgi:hypothetical protein